MKNERYGQIGGVVYTSRETGRNPGFGIHNQRDTKHTVEDNQTNRNIEENVYNAYTSFFRDVMVKLRGSYFPTEIICFPEARTRDKMEMTAPPKKGFLGFGNVPAQFTKRTIPVKLNEILSEPTNDNLYVTTYSLHGFNDGRGRPGNFLDINIILGEKGAQLLREDLKKNPKVLKELAKALFPDEFRTADSVLQKVTNPPANSKGVPTYTIDPAEIKKPSSSYVPSEELAKWFTPVK